MNEQEFLARVHASEGLRHAVLRAIEVDRASNICTFELVTDLPHTEEDEKAALAAVRAAVPQALRARVRFIKLVADEQLVRNKIKTYLAATRAAASACIAAEDIGVTLGDPIRFTLGVDGQERSFFERDERLLPDIEAMLSRNFCGRFEGAYADKVKERQDEEEESEEEEPTVQEALPVRTFRVENFEPIDEPSTPKIATYIADCDFQSQSLTVCGEITFVQERTTQKGKRYLRFSISDTTGTLGFSYFLRKKTEEKILELKQGDSIVCTGANELYNGSLGFTARYINRGTVPEGFVPEKRKSKSAPAHYTRVSPVRITDYNQLNLFEQSALPDDLVKNTFVVFDLETTGLNTSPASGRMDAITEIGAVKIIGGEIREQFSTLVNPERKLDAEIVKLTGITDDMLADAPKIAEVIPDFYKFCDGCLLVAHNAPFDSKFVRYYGEEEGYMFEQKVYDTVSIAQSFLYLSNYKLNTLADHYGITFNHHRAADDALATAKIFIEMIKAKKCLPKA